MLHSNAKWAAVSTLLALQLWSVGGLAATPIGVWAATEYFAQDPVTGVKKHPFGDAVAGVAVYTTGGHMSVLVTARDRMAAPADAPDGEQIRAKLWESLYAYAGTYQATGADITIHVESAWQPDWVGTDKTRSFRITGDVLTITTPPMHSPVDGKVYISVTRFRRVE